MLSKEANFILHIARKMITNCLLRIYNVKREMYYFYKTEFPCFLNSV